MCSTIVEQSVQTGSTPFNIFENKRKVESMLNVTRFKLDSTCFQQCRGEPLNRKIPVKINRCLFEIKAENLGHLVFS